MKKIVLGLFGVIFLSACGFSPLYVQKKDENAWYSGSSYDISITTEMAQVKVEHIKDRFGQMVRNNLMDNLTPKGAPYNAKYRLVVIPEEPWVILQALREDITATREKTRYWVKYMMYDSEGNELFKNDSISYVSYDVLTNPYSTTMAAKRAEENAAKIIADDITLRVGAYFHSVLSPKG